MNCFDFFCARHKDFHTEKLIKKCLKSIRHVVPSPMSWLTAAVVLSVNNPDILSQINLPVFDDSYVIYRMCTGF